MRQKCHCNAAGEVGQDQRGKPRMHKHGDADEAACVGVAGVDKVVKRPGRLLIAVIRSRPKPYVVEARTLPNVATTNFPEDGFFAMILESYRQIRHP